MFASFCFYAQNCGPATTTTTSSSGSLVSSGANSSSATSLGGQSFSYLNGSQHGLLRHMNNAVFSGKYTAASATYKTIKGNPYLTKKAVAGTLVMNDGTSITDVPLKYDTFADEVIATNHKGEDIVLDTRFYKEMVMTIDDDEVVFKKVNPKKPNKFYALLYDDRGLTFFKEVTTKMKEGENKGVAKIQARFRNYTKYYLKEGEGDVAKVNLKKKDVLSYFPQLEAIAMEEYCKKKGIKLKKEKDFIAMFEGTQ